MLLTMMASTATAWGQTRDDLVLTFPLTSNPGGWPTSNSTTLTNYTYTLNNVVYTFALKNVKCNSGYLMLTQQAALGLPAISGYKLTKVVASNSGGCSTATKVGISSSASSPDYIEGGAIQTWSTTSSSYTYTLTSTDANTMYYIYVTNKNAQIIELELTYSPTGSTDDPSISADNVELAFDATGGAIEYTINNPVTGGNLTAEVTNGDWLENLQVGETVTFNCDPNQAAAARTATVKLTYTYSAKETVTKNVTVTQAGNPDAPGTQNNPYTVAQARAAIDAGTGTQGVYATGIVSQIVTPYGTNNYTNITFNFVDEAGDEDFLQAFRCVSTETADASQVAVNDVVVVYGNLTFYATTSTYEFGQGCQLISLEHPVITDPYIEAANIDLTYDSTSGLIEYEIQNYVAGEMTATTEATWINDFSYDQDEENGEVGFTTTQNTAAAARTATVTLTYTYGDNQTTTKDVTVTQAGNPDVTMTIAEVRTLTAGTVVATKGIVTSITENSGKKTAYMQDNTAGIVVYGAFTTDVVVGDEIRVEGELTAYKGLIEIGTSNNAPTVTVLSQNNTVTPAVTTIAEIDINIQAMLIRVENATVTAISGYNTTIAQGTNTIIVRNLSGVEVNNVISLTANVGWYEVAQLANPTDVQIAAVPYINLTEHASIHTPVSPYQIVFDYVAQGGNIDGVEYGNFPNALQPTDFHIQFCNAQGEPTDITPDWFLQDYPYVNLVNDNLYLNIAVSLNEGETRTAYFKVYAFSTATDAVYSDLVTVTQTEYVAPVASITVDPDELTLDYEEHDGTLNLTYENLEIQDMTDFGIQYYDAVGEETEEPEWIEVLVAEQDPIIGEGYVVSYYMFNNEGEARTAYFKVYAMDDNTNLVYSNLVTINQAAGSTPPTPGQYEWVLTDLADLTANDVFVIVGDNGNTYAMANDNGTSAPTVVSVTIANGAISSTVADNIQWNLSTSDDGYTFYPNGSTETWLYCTNANNGVRVGTGDAKHFTLDDTFGYLTTTETSDQRYIGIYSSQDWRCYKLDNNQIHSNIAGQTFAFYKRVPASTEPSITLNQYVYNLNADGGQAELPVVYNNMPADPQAEVIFYESDGVTPLTENPTWITATINDNNNVDGNIQANTGEARSAYFKVKGKDADNNDVYSDLVTINQAAYVLSIVFETTELNIEVGGEQDRVLSFEYQGFGQNPTFEVRQYDATGQTQTTYEWLTTTITQGDKVNITVAANTGAARSGYFKVYGEKNANVNTESNLVTINQFEYVAPTYTVTYDANGGLGTMTDPNSPYVENDEVTLLENTFTAPEGKKWDSWLVQDANQTEIEVNEGKFNMPASDVTVSAQWVVDPDVPTYEWVLTTLEDLTENDIFVIVGNNGSNYAMTNDNGTGSAPAATAVTIANNKLSNAPANNLKWNISGNATDGYVFYPNGSTTTWLYCLSNNNGLRVGNSSDKTFEIKDNYLYNQGQGRYIGIYNSSDWRSYTTINNNIANQTFGFYKRQEASTDPHLYTNDVIIESDATEGEINYTLENPIPTGILTAAITEGNEGNWLTLGSVGATVPFTCLANTDPTVRTATVTLTYSYGETSISATAVVTQAAFVIDYATLPFAFDGGRADIENVNGLTQEGLDSDYGSSPKLKFNSTGDWMILKLNQAPVSLSYDIKGNGFSGSIFTVQTSANGTDYSDLATYTELGDMQSITHVDLDADVRYIKWIYTNKDKGNVALGNIHVTENYDTYGDVTINNLDLSATSESLIIHKGSAVIIDGVLTNASPDNLIIEDGGQLVFNSTGVQATMKKSTEHAASSTKDAADWYTIASPLASAVATNDVEHLTNSGEYDLYRYNEGSAMWENAKDNGLSGGSGGFTTLEVGRGYLYWNENGEDLAFAGELINADVNYTLTAGGEGSLKGFNLIGNPFSQNITMANINTGGDPLSGGYVLSQAGAWDATVSSIQPCQGFLVQVSAETDITISKTTSSKSQDNRNYIAFKVANSQYEDVTYALYDNAMGLTKISHRNSEIPMVYIQKDGQNYAIATMGDDTEMFNLNFRAMTTGKYTLSFNTEGKYDYLHVIDRFTGDDIDMLLDGEYSFISSTSDNDNRFIVKLHNNANSNVEDNGIFAFQNGNDIIVNGEGELQVFDVTGRMISAQHVNGFETVSVPTTGVYVFRMIGNDVKTQKIVVK